VITAVDTSVLIDVFGADPTFGPASAAALRACQLEGRLVACDVVWVETISIFPAAAVATDLLGRVGVDYDHVDRPAAERAAEAWRTYRDRGGRRTRLVADFLIGAHASRRADRLLTRDRGFYRTYFADVNVLDPARA